MQNKTKGVKRDLERSYWGVSCTAFDLLPLHCRRVSSSTVYSTMLPSYMYMYREREGERARVRESESARERECERARVRERERERERERDSVVSGSTESTEMLEFF